jgi:hypothetical protein
MFSSPEDARQGKEACHLRYVAAQARRLGRLATY